jgi:RHS repeat-associated protein
MFRSRVCSRLLVPVSLLFLGVPLLFVSATAGAARERSGSTHRFSGGLRLRAATDAANYVPASAPAGVPAPARELPELRTRTGRTYVADGHRFAVLYPGSVNYRDAAGRWQPIDNALVPAEGGGAHVNRASNYSVRIPDHLGGAPVRIERPDASLSFALQGATGAGSVAGSVATFANAMPGVTIRDSAENDQVEETLTLASAATPTSFAYRIDVSGGLAATQKSGSEIDFRNAAGHVEFGFAAPSMVDAAGATSRAVSLRLASDGTGYLVTLTADPRWLASAQRRWPVTIDPLVWLFNDPDCSISSATPDQSLCGSPTLQVGTDGAGTTYRSLLDFSIHDQVPYDATVNDAKLGLYLSSDSSCTSVPVSVHEVTKPWGRTTATWNRYDGVNAWTTAGGDFNATTAVVPNVGCPVPADAAWYPIRLMQGWVDGSIVHNGFLLKNQTEATANVLSFVSFESTDSAHWPVMIVNYDASFGDEAYYSFDRHGLTDSTDVAVNVANGNLVLRAHDLHLEGTGLDLDLSRTYNSQAAINNYLSQGWNLSAGPDVELDAEDDGSVQVDPMPNGHGYLFANDGSGGYVVPAGIDAKLTKLSDLKYTLKFNRSDDLWTFDTKLPVGADDRDPQLVSQQDKNGNTVTYGYDANGTWTQITDTKGGVTQIAHNGDGTISQITDPAGRTYTYGFDPMTHRLTSFTAPDPDGAGPLTAPVTSYGYDANGYLNQITSPRGNITKIVYDSAGRVQTLTHVTKPANGTGPKTTFTYHLPSSPSGGSTDVKDPNLHTTSDAYDNHDRVVSLTDPLGHTHSVDYTNAHGGTNCADNQICSATDARLKTTTYDYDANGNNNLIAIHIPTGATDQFAYTDTSHPFYTTKHTDPQTNFWKYSYDTTGNLSQKEEGEGQNPIKFHYNSNGTVKGALDAKGTATASCPFDTVWNSYPTVCYSYDGNGNLTGITQPSPLGSESFSYDTPLNRVHTATDGAGHQETYTYDNLDRVTRIDYSDGSSISYGYDGDGNLSSMTDPIGTTSFVYDSLNRLTSESLPGSRTNQYGYDSASNLTSFTDAGGTITYGYDNADNLTSVVQPGPQTIAFSYDENDNRLKTTYPGGVYQCTKYDDSQRLSSIDARTISDCTPTPTSAQQLTKFTYSYANGTADTNLRQSVIALVTGLYSTTTTYFCYDTPNHLNRLTRAATAQCQDPATSGYQYAYDANGNMCRKNTGASISGFNCSSTGASVTSYSYNGANELTGINGGSGFSYDGNGNLTGSPSYSSLVYNVRDQTTSITPAGQAAVPFSYRGPLQALRESAGGTSYTDSQLGVSYEKTGTTTTYYTREPNGHLLAKRVSSTRNYYLEDGLGSIVGLTNGTTSVVDKYKYDPYGNLIASSGTVANPWRYAGYYYDTSTTLYKVGLRYYNPAVARWTQRDITDSPLDEHGWNRYIYVGDDPCNQTDPSGAVPVGNCASYRARGSAGYVAFQMFAGRVLWGTYLYKASENLGLWQIDVFVGRRRVDSKSQLYPPHGSISARDVKPGQIVTVIGFHASLVGFRGYSVIGKCRVP